MKAVVLAPTPRERPISIVALDAAGRLWFAVVVVGQAAFLYYILGVYGVTTLSGDFQAWDRNPQLIGGYMAGDMAGNLAFAAHVLLAAVVTFGGTLQLIPQIRARAPAIHRWTGRLFLGTAMAGSLIGLYLIWVRGDSTGPPDNVAITLDGILILAFGALAWRAAVTRDFAAHRRWAMRTFIVANGVFFLRLGVVAYAILSSGAANLLPSLKAFFGVWVFGSYLAPLAVLELYLFAKDRGGPGPRFAMASGLLAITALTGIGIAGAWLGLWAPVLAAD